MLLVTIRDTESQHSLFSGKWMAVTKLQSQRKSLSTPEEPYALDILIITIQVRKDAGARRQPRRPPRKQAGFRVFRTSWRTSGAALTGWPRACTWAT